MILLVSLLVFARSFKNKSQAKQTMISLRYEAAIAVFNPAHHPDLFDALSVSYLPS